MDNTLVIYLMGDNGASAEGSPNGLLNEMTFFNNIQSSIRRHLQPHGRTGRTEHVWPLSVRVGSCDGHSVSVDQTGCLTLVVALGTGLAIAWPKRIKDRGQDSITVPPCH